MAKVTLQVTRYAYLVMSNLTCIAVAILKGNNLIW